MYIYIFQIVDQFWLKVVDTVFRRILEPCPGSVGKGLGQSRSTQDIPEGQWTAQMPHIYHPQG